MFERFTRDARAVVIGAQETAREQHDSQIRCVHLLIGLTLPEVATHDLLAGHAVTADAIVGLLDDDGQDDLDASALETLGIDLDAIRSAVEARFGEGALDRPPGRSRWWGRRGLTPPGHLRFTEGAKKSLELSLREALRLKSNRIDAAALLLGLLRADDPGIIQVISGLGVDKPALRADAEAMVRRAA